MAVTKKRKAPNPEWVPNALNPLFQQPAPINQVRQNIKNTWNELGHRFNDTAAEAASWVDPWGIVKGSRSPYINVRDPETGELVIGADGKPISQRLYSKLGQTSLKESQRIKNFDYSDEDLFNEEVARISELAELSRIDNFKTFVIIYGLFYI